MTLEPKKCSNSRPYREAILQPKRGNRIAFFFKKNAEKSVFEMFLSRLNFRVINFAKSIRIEKTETFLNETFEWDLNFKISELI